MIATQHDMSDMMPMPAHELTGDFAGHVLPGIGLTVWAVVWLLHLRRDAGNDSARSMEHGAVVPWIKVAVGLIGILAHIPPTRWSAMSKAMAWQHASMFLPFTVAGLADLVARRGRLGPQSTLLATAFAVGNAIVLFLGHGNSAGLESLSHRLMIALLSAVLLGLAVEMLRPSSMIRWFRSAAMLAAGLWFMVIGWLLYRSGWSLEDPVNEMWTYVLWSNTTTLAVLGTFMLRQRRPAV